MGIDDLKYEVGSPDFGKRRFKALNEVGRQLLNEANGIGKRDLATLVQINRARRGVKRGKELVFGVDPGIRKRVQ